MKNRARGGGVGGGMHLLPLRFPSSCQEVKRSAVKLERVSREHSGKERRKGKCQQARFYCSVPRPRIPDACTATRANFGTMARKPTEIFHVQCYVSILVPSVIIQRIMVGAMTPSPQGERRNEQVVLSAECQL